MTTPGVAQEETVGLHRVGGEQEMADSKSGKVIGAFERRGSSMSASGMTVAEEEAGHVAFDELLIEVYQEMIEVSIGTSVFA
jgi:hypothetical protein